MREEENMKNIDILKELLSERGVAVDCKSKYVNNKGDVIQYTFAKNNTVQVSFDAKMIDALKACELEDFVENGIFRAFNDETYSMAEEMPNNIVDLMKTGEIMPCAINTEGNKEYLDSLVHRDAMDLSLYYRLIVKVDDTGLSSIVINNDLMERAGIVEEELFQRAKKYVKEHMEVMSLFDLLGGFVEREAPDEANAAMYVLRYDVKTNGAGILVMAAYDEEILMGVCESYPVIVLPSSTDEILLVKTEKNDGEADSFGSMVADVNLYQVEEDLLLSNSVYVLMPDGKIQLAEQGAPLAETIAKKKELKSLFGEMFSYCNDSAEAV